MWSSNERSGSRGSVTDPASHESRQEDHEDFAKSNDIVVYDDKNEHDEPIRLYVPILHGSRNNHPLWLATSRNPATTCYIGGSSRWQGGGERRRQRQLRQSHHDHVDKSLEVEIKDREDDSPHPTCFVCHDPLFLLVHMYIPASTSTNIAAHPNDQQKQARQVGKILQVFACNRASCVQHLFIDTTATSSNGTTSFLSAARKSFCFGGGGVIVCRRQLWIDDASNAETTTTATTSNPTTTSATPAAGAAATPAATNDGGGESSAWNDDVNDDVTNEWMTEDSRGNVTNNEWDIMATNANKDAVDDNDASSLAELESKLAALETQSASTRRTLAFPRAKSPRDKTAGPKQKLHPVSDGAHNAAVVAPAFPCFALHSVQEPPSFAIHRNGSCGDDDDDEDVGMAQLSDDTIQAMLARYMAEEDDVDILAALRGNTTNSGAGGDGSRRHRERDQRLSPRDKALWTFTDRLKRCPQQVVRHSRTRGDTPLWSIPVTDSNCTTLSSIKNGSKGRGGSRSKPPNHQGHERHTGASESQLVPPCPRCQQSRMFELQILPSILHALQVDRYAPTDQSDPDMNQLTDGMNWGNVAIYTCPSMRCSQEAARDGFDEEFVVVQAPIDDMPLHVGMMSFVDASRTAQQQQQEQYRPKPWQEQPIVIAEDTVFEDDDDGDFIIMDKDFENQLDLDGDDDDYDEMDEDNNGTW